MYLKMHPRGCIFFKGALAAPKRGEALIRYLTAGESHGKSLTSIIEGVPANLNLAVEDINKELSRRQIGYGRGGRMAIEKDEAEIISGVRFGKTIGSPIAMVIKNRDWENWKEVMNTGVRGQGSGYKEVTRPRPGHADLAGALKYGQYDIRNILERSSARETAARVAVGAVCKRFLDEFGIKVMSRVVEIAGVSYKMGTVPDPKSIFERAESSDVRCPDKAIAEKMRKAIDRAKKNGDSLGGIFEVAVTDVPPGLGSHVQWDRKLDGNLARALMSIQAIKGVEVGMGFGVAERLGSEVHDEIFYTPTPSIPHQGGGRGRGEVRSQKESLFWPIEQHFYRKTNNAGG